MLIGHYSAAFAAKRIEPRLPLWALLLAAQFVDIVWAVFILTGIEKANLDPGLASNPLVLYFMPYTHSLLATFVWGFAAFIVGFVWIKGRFRRLATGIVLSAVVMSHWFLDLLVHRPDLPLWDDSVKVGLGLWDQPFLALLLEIALVLGSLVWLMRSTVHNGSRIHQRVLILSGLLLLLQLGSFFGATPHLINAVALSGLAVYFLTALLGRWAEQT
jgi:hypothetical protein